MEIKNVTLQVIPEVKSGAMEDGLPLAPHPEIVTFLVDVEGEAADITVPIDPANADYWLVKEWYDNQETKPFDFNFEQLAKPEFEETIYPEEPEEQNEESLEG